MKTTTNKTRKPTDTQAAVLERLAGNANGAAFLVRGNRVHLVGLWVGPDLRVWSSCEDPVKGPTFKALESAGWIESVDRDAVPHLFNRERGVGGPMQHLFRLSRAGAEAIERFGIAEIILRDERRRRGECVACGAKLHKENQDFYHPEYCIHCI